MRILGLNILTDSQIETIQKTAAVRERFLCETNIEFLKDQVKRVQKDAAKEWGKSEEIKQRYDELMVNYKNVIYYHDVLNEKYKALRDKRDGV